MTIWEGWRGGEVTIWEGWRGDHLGGMERRYDNFMEISKFECYQLM